MRDSFVQAKAVIEDSGYTLEQIREYLDDLRDTGRIKFYGASDYLINVWGFSRHEVQPIVLEYINYGLREENEFVALGYGRQPIGDQDDDDI